MALPLPTLGFYRGPDVALAAATAVAFIDALHTALNNVATDFQGNAIPNTAQWPFTKYQNAGVSEAVYNTGVPTSSPMTATPRYCIGAVNAARTPGMNIDTYANNVPIITMALRAGAFSAWDAALGSTFTSGPHSGAQRFGAAAMYATSTVIRAYFSAEWIFVDVIQSATVHYWLAFGAYIHPYSSDTVNCSETDFRIYGFMTSGSAQVGANWSYNTGGNDWLTHGGANGNAHGLMMIPGTVTNGTGGVYNVECEQLMKRAPAAAQKYDLSGASINRPILMGRSGPLEPVGWMREAYFAGLVRGGFTGSTAGVNKRHDIATDTSAADDAFSLRAA